MTAYLVRMQYAFRFYDKEGNWGFQKADTYQRIFADSNTAFDYSIDHMPTQANPFEHGATLRPHRGV